MHGGDTVGIRWGYGGGKVGVRWGYCIPEGALQCAILAHNPILASIVNQQSIPQQTLLGPSQTCASLAHSSRNNAISTASSRNPEGHVDDLRAIDQIPHGQGVFRHEKPQYQSTCFQ